MLLLGESGKSHRKRSTPIHTSPRGSWGPYLPGVKSREPRSPQILQQPGQNASSRRELSIGASHELSFGECWKNHGKRITPIDTSPRGSGGPCLPGAKSGEPKRPRIPKRSPQNASSRRELSIGAPHARDTPSRSRGTFEGHLTGPRPEARDLHFRATPSRLVRVDGSRKLPQISVEVCREQGH